MDLNALHSSSLEAEGNRDDVGPSDINRGTLIRKLTEAIAKFVPAPTKGDAVTTSKESEITVRRNVRGEDSRDHRTRKHMNSTVNITPTVARFICVCRSGDFLYFFVCQPRFDWHNAPESAVLYVPPYPFCVGRG
jgi:hypothetical protein